ncbi:3-hydroxyacyl-CoA dehydrogenase family protein [Aneurinibacillus terranovensis]|uniref:3-hydroxyacyl-CoA dehydrogenase family protein n=1 Tax=Aneurinibacillus terranovensis TaxID=278991 RepID=UPI00040FC95E|nr:3-hydroxyacyl-CoA dehydrogenase family protein [Aneurinibacillus terranovensis]
MNTASKAVVLAGQSPLFGELKQLLVQHGYSVITVDELEEGHHPVDLAIEVSNLDLDEKKSIIQKLDQLLPPQVPITSTSLAITATEIASWADFPERVCGFGTLVPLCERQLIEMAPALQTGPAAMETVAALFQTLGKEMALVEDEVGLVFPRILSLIINEAVFAVMEGTATPEDIDVAMKKGTNYPYGPLEWADRIGLDEVFSIIRGMYQNLGEERYRPAPLLRKMVLAKRLGERTGQGFYTYTAQEAGVK